MASAFVARKSKYNVQIVAIALIMFAASFPAGSGYYLPTIYTSVFTLAMLSGVHYVFFVSKLMNEERRQPPSQPTSEAK